MEAPYGLLQVLGMEIPRIFCDVFCSTAEPRGGIALPVFPFNCEGSYLLPIFVAARGLKTSWLCGLATTPQQLVAGACAPQAAQPASRRYSSAVAQILLQGQSLNELPL